MIKRIDEKIEVLKRRRQECEALQEQIEDRVQKQISLDDPDARSVPVGKSRGTEVVYNVQVSVDAKHKLIVDHEVSNEVTDVAQLIPMGIRILGVPGLMAARAGGGLFCLLGKSTRLLRAFIETYHSSQRERRHQSPALCTQSPAGADG